MPYIEPHKKTIPLDSPLQGFNGLADDYPINSGKINRVFGAKKIKDMVWTYSDARLCFFSQTLKGIAKGAATAGLIANIKTVKLTPKSEQAIYYSAAQNDKCIALQVGNTSGVVMISAQAYTDVASMLAEYGEDLLVYELQNPYTETVDPVAIKALDTMPTVLTVSADGEVTYNHDTNHALKERDDRITRLETALIALGGAI